MNFSLIISNSSGTRRTFTFLDRSPTSLDQLDTLQLLIKSRTSGYHPGFHASSCLLQLASAHLSLAVPLHLFLLQQLKPGWSLSRLAGSANLHIVPFIRRALTHNKRQLTLHLETRLGHDCTWMVRGKHLSVFHSTFCLLFLPIPKSDPEAAVGRMFTAVESLAGKGKTFLGLEHRKQLTLAQPLPCKSTNEERAIQARLRQWWAQRD